MRPEFKSARLRHDVQPNRIDAKPMPGPTRQRRRIPNVTTLIEQAHKAAQKAGVNLAGATVTVTTPDGSATVTFGRADGQAPGIASNVNEWDAEYGEKAGKAQTH